MGEHETEVSSYQFSRFDKSNVFLFSFSTCKGSEIWISQLELFMEIVSPVNSWYEQFFLINISTFTSLPLVHGMRKSPCNF